jgi:hypothetical protein
MRKHEHKSGIGRVTNTATGDVWIFTARDLTYETYRIRRALLGNRMHDEYDEALIGVNDDGSRGYRLTRKRVGP